MTVTLWTRDKKFEAQVFRIFGRPWHIHIFRHHSRYKRQVSRAMTAWPLSAAIAKARYQMRKLRDGK